MPSPRAGACAGRGPGAPTRARLRWSARRPDRARPRMLSSPSSSRSLPSMAAQCSCLGRHPHDADLGSGALGGGEQPHRVLVGAEPRRHLGERVQAAGHVGRVAALDADVEVGERVLLGVRPVAARGGEAAEGEAGPRRKEAMAESARRSPAPRARWPRRRRPPAGGAPRRAAQSAQIFVVAPRPSISASSPSSRSRARSGRSAESSAKASATQQHWHGIAGAEPQGVFEPPRQALERPLGLALPGICKPLASIRVCLEDRLAGVRHRRSHPRERLSCLGKATVDVCRQGDERTSAVQPEGGRQAARPARPPPRWRGWPGRVRPGTGRREPSPV